MSGLDVAILGQIPPGTPLRVGRVGSLSPLTVTLDGAPTAAIAGPAAGVLAVGESVLTASYGGTVWVHSVLEPRPQTGVVVSVASGLATITAGGVLYPDVPVRVGTAAPDDSVLMVWGSEGAVAIAGGSAAAPARPPSPVVPEWEQTPASMDRTSGGMIDARVTSVRTSRAGAYRTDGKSLIRAYQGVVAGGAANTGWFFYGGALALPVDADMECVGCVARMARPREAGAPTAVDFHFRLHAAATPGAAPPALVAGAEQVHSLAWGETRTIDLGVEWGQRLLDGEAAGLALSYSGADDYAALSGPGEAPLAGQVLLYYRPRVTDGGLPSTPNLVANPGPAVNQALGDDPNGQWLASGWWSDADQAYMSTYEVGGVIYTSGPIPPYEAAEIDPTFAQRVTYTSPYAPTLGAPVSAGTSYAGSVYVLSTLGAGKGFEVRLGVVWYDATGVEISTDWGAAVPVLTGAYPWFEGDTQTPWPSSYAQARPTVNATAPTGAALGRLLLEGEFTDGAWGGDSYQVSTFILQTA